MTSSKTQIYSTFPSERIISIDVLRGVAVLGILIMNIQSFSMIGAAYINPTAYGDLSDMNKWVWIFSNLFANDKFMSIFSMLFGAGIIIFTSRAVAKGKSAGNLHYRRIFWLFIFGMIHAYLIWYGDILVAYSLCGALVFVFRKMKPKTLVLISIAFFIIPVLFNLGSGLTIKYWPEESYNQNMQTWLPPADVIENEISIMRGSWIEQMKVRVPSAFFLQTFLFLWQSFWRIISMMLLGMALYKWGILSAQRSKMFYLKLALTGLIAGFFITGVGIIENFNAGWSMDYSMFFGSQFNYIGSIGVALGYISLVMLVCKSLRFIKFKHIFSAIGKMAFTNYILMSIICTLIFYGHGLGLFGQVERSVQILIVFAIWILIMIISPIWLKHYQYGPLEWLWRVLTYWKVQPMRIGH